MSAARDEGAGVAILLQRAWRAALLDDELYAELRDDPAALGQAAAIVSLSALCAGIGVWTNGGLVGLLLGLGTALASWYVWAYLAYVIGASFYPGENDPSLSEVLRTMGFASAPGVLRVLTGLPEMAWIVQIGCSAWMLMAAVIALQSAFGYREIRRAAGVGLMGWAAHVVSLGLLRDWFFA